MVAPGWDTNVSSSSWTGVLQLLKHRRYTYRLPESTGVAEQSPEEMNDLEIFANAALQGRTSLFLRRMRG